MSPWLVRQNAWCRLCGILRRRLADFGRARTGRALTALRASHTHRSPQLANSFTLSLAPLPEYNKPAVSGMLGSLEENFMNPIRPSQLLRAIAAFAIFSLGLVNSSAQTETVLHTFTGGSDGELPFSGVTLDSAGNLYGTTWDGGSAGCGGYGCGTVFELSPTTSGNWQETILFRFTGSQTGGLPVGNLVIDGNGNIFGADLLGGSDAECSSDSGGLTGCGLVFELSPTSVGLQESLPALFDSSPAGELPYGGVVPDSLGNLYGTTWQGGILTACVNGCGTVFRLSPTGSGAWEETILHTFTGGNDGGGSQSSLIFDAAGNLYGTAGVVFKLSNTASGGWKETVLYTFSGGADGSGSFTSLVLDAAGNLYGTTPSGGNLSGCNGYGCGVVFKLFPTRTGGWKHTVLYKFRGKGAGSFPHSPPPRDPPGQL